MNMDIGLYRLEFFVDLCRLQRTVRGSVRFHLHDVETPDEVGHTVAFPREDGLCEQECIEPLILQGGESPVTAARLRAPPGLLVWHPTRDSGDD